MSIYDGPFYTSRRPKTACGPIQDHYPINSSYSGYGDFNNSPPYISQRRIYTKDPYFSSGEGCYEPDFSYPNSEYYHQPYNHGYENYVRYPSNRPGTSQSARSEGNELIFTSPDVPPPRVHTPDIIGYDPEYPFPHQLPGCYNPPSKPVYPQFVTVSNEQLTHTKGNVQVEERKSYREHEINTDSVHDGTNKDLTVMLRNVPNRYRQEDLVNFLTMWIPNGFSVVSFPMDSKTKRNLGYCFIHVNDNQTLNILLESCQDKLWPHSPKQKVIRICRAIDKKKQKEAAI